LQRASAALLAPFVLGHLAVMFYATGSSLTAADILGRTSGSIGWALFYCAFVIVVAVHGAIGLRAIAIEWGHVGERKADAVMLVTGAVLVLLGLRAVFAVIAPGVA
ncbi:MAG: succinate dehydrogenase, partial [Pseudomonadota bacterium]